MCVQCIDMVVHCCKDGSVFLNYVISDRGIRGSNPGRAAAAVLTASCCVLLSAGRLKGGMHNKRSM